MSVNKITDLMLACKNGDVNSVKELLKKGVYVHELYNNKEEETIVDKSALTYASENGHNDIVFLLIYAGALNLKNLDSYDKSQVSIAIRYSLLNAIANNHYEVCKTLLYFGVSPNMATIEDNVSVLHIAVYKNNIQIVRLLINNNVSINVKDWTRRTPLIVAVANDNYDIVKILLAAGADPNICEESCSFYAAKNCNYNIISALSDYGVKLNYNDFNDLLTDDFLITHKDIVDIVADFFNKEDFNDMFVDAVFHEQFIVAKKFLEKGADVNAVSNACESSALELSVTFQQLDSFNFLINNGADIHNINREGKNLIDYILDDSTYKKIKICKRDYKDDIEFIHDLIKKSKGIN